jgi:hypothetical protein
VPKKKGCVFIFSFSFSGKPPQHVISRPKCLNLFLLLGRVFLRWVSRNSFLLDAVLLSVREITVADYTHSVLVDLLLGFVPCSRNSFSQAWVLPNIPVSRPTVSNVRGTHFTISTKNYASVTLWYQSFSGSFRIFLKHLGCT